MAEKESQKFQEMGPKKYKAELERQNKLYDKYKAGTRDPKTGDYYYHIGVKPPRKGKTGRDLGSIECPICSNCLSIQTSTVAIICSNCSTYISFNYDKEKEEISIREVKPRNG